jgi:DNA polymerase III epsilon subunit-like protein
MGACGPTHRVSAVEISTLAPEVEAGLPAQPPTPRPRYGRRRGRVPVGDRFVSRLGPAEDEPFAAIDDPADGASRTRPTPDTPIDQLRFVALDCETTGQSPHHLVELGAVAFTVDRHLMSFETLVHSNDRINPYARRIHGIGPENLHGAPPVSRVVARFRRFVEGSVLVEHSADAFDTRLIARTIGTDLDADNLDTTRLAATIWQLRDTIGLERLCRELGVTHRRPHHALADAEATAASFLALLKLGAAEFGWRTLGDLLAVGQPPPIRISDDPVASNGHGGAVGKPRRRRRPRRSQSQTSQTSQPATTPNPD